MPTQDARIAHLEAKLEAAEKTIDALSGAVDGLRRRHDLQEEAYNDGLNGKDGKPGLYTRVAELERKERFVSAIVKWLFISLGGLGVSALSQLIPWGKNPPHTP